MNEESKKKSAGRNIKIYVTDDISHTKLTENEYKILEEYTEKQEDERLNENYQDRLDLSNDE